MTSSRIFIVINAFFFSSPEGLRELFWKFKSIQISQMWEYLISFCYRRWKDVKCRFVLFSNLSLATVTQAFTWEVSACFENLRFDLFLRLLLKCASILTDAFKMLLFCWQCSALLFYMEHSRNLQRLNRQCLHKTEIQKVKSFLLTVKFVSASCKWIGNGAT